jgi:hypothetical protein
MMRFLTLAAACLALAACTTTNVKSAAGLPAAPPQGAKVLIVQPDIELSLLTFAGLAEARADWTASARTNMQTAVEAALRGKSHSLKVLDPATAMDGREGQLLRLHGAVGSSIILFNYGFIPLPTKKDSFDWTLGEGAQVLATRYESDYALFVYGRGSYSSGGRLVAAALVGGPTGSQQVFASLVDLKTGRADMRTPEGAAMLTASLLKDVPL